MLNVNDPAPVHPASIPVVMIPQRKLILPTNDIRITRNDENLDRLAEDIRQRGIVNPLHVLTLTDGNFEIMAGTTRFQAGCRIPLKEYPCIVHTEPLDEGELTAMRVLDEVLHTPLNKIELGAACERLMKLKGLPQAGVAALVKLSEGEVSRVMKVFTDLAPDLKDQVADGTLCPSKAFQLARLKGKFDRQRELAALNLKREALKKKVDVELGKRVRMTRPVKFCTSGGLTVIVPGDFDYESAEAELKEALKRIRRGKGFDDDPSGSPVLLPTG